MNDGGNPSVGGGGFAASPAGTAPLYYKSAEIASGSAKNLCKKSEDVGGCALRGTGYPCHCGKSRGACPVGRLPTLPLACFPAPYPPSPLPRRGRGRPRLFHARGFAPCIPGAEPRRHLQNLPNRYPAGSLQGWSPAAPAFTFFSAPYPPAPFPDGEGGAPKFISPGASPPALLHLTACGTHRACQAGTRRQKSAFAAKPTGSGSL